MQNFFFGLPGEAQTAIIGGVIALLGTVLKWVLPCAQRSVAMRKDMRETIGSSNGHGSIADMVGHILDKVDEFDGKLDEQGTAIAALQANVDGLGQEIAHMRDRATDQAKLINTLISK
jgi:hypothetical protein